MITVHVRLFAGLHQLIGERAIEMRLPDGATIEQLRTALGEQYPIVVALLPTLVCAIDEEYVEPSQVLRDGDHVALIPPVSGGARNRSMTSTQIVIATTVGFFGLGIATGGIDLQYLGGLTFVWAFTTLALVGAQRLGRRRELRNAGNPSPHATPSVRRRVALLSVIAVVCFVALSVVYQDWLRVLVIVLGVWMLVIAPLLIMWRFRREPLEQRGFRW